MKIKDIKLKNFRNYEDEKASFSEKINIFIGKNGQGKTNLLEALYFSSMGRSFRTSKDKELIRIGMDFTNIHINYIRDGYDETFKGIIRKDGKKKLEKSGIVLEKISELMGEILTVIFSPEDLKIVKEEPEKRRKFIDKELCQLSPKYLNSLSKYKKLLLQKNMYLKGEKIDKILLDIWNRQLAKEGFYIIKERKKFIEKLEEISNKIMLDITEEKENLKLKYKSNSFGETEEECYELISSSYEDDIRNRTSLIGPHKDDFKIISNDINIRKFGSQGQQRTAALSLKLSELAILENETGRKPILLLDDVMSELDPYRQEYLIKSFNKNQIFITMAELNDGVKKIKDDINIIEINNGKIIS